SHQVAVLRILMMKMARQVRTLQLAKPQNKPLKAVSRIFPVTDGHNSALWQSFQPSFLGLI
ncbi:MAG: hypothetical protein QNL57_04180, partial [Alphaproteobacteria bacterium]